MTDEAASRRVTIEDDGRVVAEAYVVEVDPIGSVQADVHVEPGHLPPGTRSRLVADVFDAPEVRAADRFTGVVPRGDAEVLAAVRSHLSDPVTRAAGATIIVEADTPNS